MELRSSRSLRTSVVVLTPAALHRAPRRLLNEILSCDSWESLQTRVRTAAVEGELSDKTLSALQQVMQQAVGRGEQADPRVVSSLEQAGQLIQATLAQMQMPPAMQLLDQLLMLDPQSEAASIRENLQAAIGSGQVTAAESLQTVDGLMDMMEQQEVEIEKRIEEGTATDNPEEFQEMLNLVKARQEAKVRLASIKTVLKAIADEAS